MIDAAMVGLGRWGQTILSSIQGKSERLRIVHGVSKEAAPGRELAARYGFRLSGDLEDAIADPAVQAILLATPHSLHVEQVCQVVRGGVTRRVIAQMSRSHLESTGFADWALRELMLMDPKAIVQAAAALGKYTMRHWVREIDVPTSVLVHIRDQLVPPRRQFELASAIPDASVHFVDADHFAVVRDPQPFVRALIGAIHDVTLAHATETAAIRQAS